MEIVCCKDPTIRSETACPGEILLGNPYLLHASLNVTDVENFQLFIPIDWIYVHKYGEKNINRKAESPS